jgi:hypothetical protein
LRLLRVSADHKVYSARTGAIGVLWGPRRASPGAMPPLAGRVAELNRPTCPPFEGHHVRGPSGPVRSGHAGRSPRPWGSAPRSDWLRGPRPEQVAAYEAEAPRLRNPQCSQGIDGLAPSGTPRPTRRRCLSFVIRGCAPAGFYATISPRREQGIASPQRATTARSPALHRVRRRAPPGNQHVPSLAWHYHGRGARPARNWASLAPSASCQVTMDRGAPRDGVSSPLRHHSGFLRHRSWSDGVRDRTVC